MFKTPSLALCSNRNTKAQVHPILGEPEVWLGDEFLAGLGLQGIRSFEFFIDWSKNPSGLQKVFWRKQIPSNNFPCWKSASPEELLNALRTDAEFVKLVGLGQDCDFDTVAIVFNGEADWGSDENFVRSVSITPSRMAKPIENINRYQLKDKIQSLSGGPVRVLKLNYGTTTLECWLATTDGAWPGDVDLLITDINSKAKCVVEFKKHTLNTDIGLQKLGDYYPHKDGRRNQRLAILRDYLGLPENSGFVRVYYPSRAKEMRIKVENIVGPNTNLRADGEVIVEMDSNDLSAGSRRLVDVIHAFL